LSNRCPTPADPRNSRRNVRKPNARRTTHSVVGLSLFDNLFLLDFGEQFLDDFMFFFSLAGFLIFFNLFEEFFLLKSVENSQKKKQKKERFRD
jgi:hypothetical protein